MKKTLKLSGNMRTIQLDEAPEQTKTRAQQLAELLLDATHHERADAVSAWADHHATSHDHMMMLVNVVLDNLARRYREGYVDDRNRYACELAERMRVAYHEHWSALRK